MVLAGSAQLPAARARGSDSGGRPYCGGLDTVLRTRVLPLVYFVDDSITFDGTFYIEHGHKLDKYTEIVGKPVLPNSVELNIPFGSFLNRYLLDRLELVYPFLDKYLPQPESSADVV